MFHGATFRRWNLRRNTPDMNQCPPLAGSAARGLRAEHISLLIAVAALTAAIILAGTDAASPTMDLSRGVYSILSGVFVIGWSGWLAGSAGRCTRRTIETETAAVRADVAELHTEVAGLRAAVADLTAELCRSRRQRPIGSTYRSVAGQGDTVALQQAVDPEALAAAQRIHLRLLNGHH